LEGEIKNKKKIKRVRTQLKKIKYEKLGWKDEIENK
jgi:hypothetical protein